MFGEFLNIIFKSIKLDKSLYTDNKNFGEASIYFAGLIMILDGIAGAVAANTIIKTAVAMSGLTAILTWLVWAIFIYVIGVKLFPDKQTKIPFKKVLTAVGFAHAPGLLRFFAVTPNMMIPIIFLTQFWIFAGLIISTKQVLNLKSNIKYLSDNFSSINTKAKRAPITIVNISGKLNMLTSGQFHSLIYIYSNHSRYAWFLHCNAH